MGTRGIMNEVWKVLEADRKYQGVCIQHSSGEPKAHGALDSFSFVIQHKTLTLSLSRSLVLIPLTDNHHCIVIRRPLHLIFRSTILSVTSAVNKQFLRHSRPNNPIIEVDMQYIRSITSTHAQVSFNIIQSTDQYTPSPCPISSSKSPKSHQSSQRYHHTTPHHATPS
jgi:hypothetical protein